MDDIKFKINSERVYNNNLSNFIRLSNDYLLPNTIYDNGEIRNLFYLGLLLILNLTDVIKLNLFEGFLLIIIIVLVPNIFKEYKKYNIISYLEVIYASILILGISTMSLLLKDYFATSVSVIIYVIALLSIKNSSDKIINFKKDFCNHFSTSNIFFSMENQEDNILFKYQVGNENINFNNKDIIAISFRPKTDDCFLILKPVYDIRNININSDMEKFIYVKMSDLVTYLNIDKESVDFKNNSIRNINNIFIKKLKLNGDELTILWNKR